MRLSMIPSLARAIAFTKTEPASAPPVVPPVAPPVVPPVAPPVVADPAPAPVVDPPIVPPVVPVVPPVVEPTDEEKAAAAATETAAKVAAIKTALKLPEGSTLDDAALERTAATASELGLSPEAAQRVLDSLSQETDAARQSVHDSLAFGGVEWTKQNDAHQAAALADPEIGAGSIEKRDAAVAKARRGMATLFGADTAAMETFITEAGLGSAPTLVKAFMRVADKMGEAGFVPSTPVTPTAGKRAADVFYGSTQPPAQ